MLRRLTLLAFGFCVVLTLLLVLPRTVVAVPPRVDITTQFPLGVFDDLSLIGTNETRFNEILTDIKSRGMDSILLTNGHNSHATILDASDDQGINVIWASMVQTVGNYINNDSVPQSYATAESIAQSVLDATSGHESVVGYNVADDASRTKVDKMKDLVDAFKALDPSRAAMPVLVGYPDFEAVYKRTDPDIALTYNYPVGVGQEECNFYRGNYHDFVDAIRLKTQFVDEGTPTWMILQTHATGTTAGTLREPTVEELRLQNWITVGEGIKGIFWFVYTTQLTWTGLEDNTALMNEVTDFVSRISPLRPILLQTKRVDDVFYVKANNPVYVSTLYDSGNDKYYAVVANQSCEDQYVTLYSSQFDGRFKNLENDQQMPLGSTFKLAGGDGRIFELLNKSDSVSYTPTTYPNLISNNSFETYTSSTFTNWLFRAAAVQDTTKAQSGAASVKITGPQSQAYLPYGSTINFTNGDVYTATYWSQLSQSTTSINNGLLLAFTSVGSINFPRTFAHTNWEKSQLVFRVPAATTGNALQLKWELADGNTLWYDNVSICKGKWNCNGTWPYIQGSPDPRSPIGNLDSISNSGTVTGWSFDPDEPDTNIQLKMYINGTNQTGVLADTISTSVSRTDINNSYGLSSNAGFSWQIPQVYQDGSTHDLYVYAVDTSAAALTLIGNSTFRLGSATTASSSVTSSSTTSCERATPGSAPWLYGAIAQDGKSILLYYTAANDPVDHYSLEYGIEPGKYIFGASNIGGKDGRTYLVQSLQPNTTYYFRVRAGNDCATGEWSNELSAKTRATNTISQLTITQSELVPQGDNRTTTSNQTAVISPKPEFEMNEESIGGYEVNVLVKDKENKPVEGALVTLYSKVQKATTDKNGIARFMNVEPGDHKVVIAYEGYLGEQSLNLTGEIKSFDLNITIEKKGEVSLVHQPRLAYLNPVKYILIGGVGGLLTFISLLFWSRKQSVVEV